MTGNVLGLDAGNVLGLDANERDWLTAIQEVLIIRWDYCYRVLPKRCDWLTARDVNGLLARVIQ